MSVSRRWDSSPRQRVTMENAPAETVFEDINGNIGTETHHSNRLTWARMYLHEGCWQDPEVVTCYANCAEVLPLKLAPLN